MQQTRYKTALSSMMATEDVRQMYAHCPLRILGTGFIVTGKAIFGR